MKRIREGGDGNDAFAGGIFSGIHRKLDELDEVYTAARHLDEKTYQLVCLALSVKGRSAPCVRKHYMGALQAGAGMREIAEILALTMRESAGADDCWTHDVLSEMVASDGGDPADYCPR